MLHYANSGDTPYGDQGRVVGYGTVVFYQTNNNNAGTRHGAFLQPIEQQIALALARHTMELEFNLTDEIFTDYKNYPIFSEKRGVFVTLNKQESLRGCIGLIEPIKPLAEAIMEMSLAAALTDPRFSPITPDELNQIDIEISVLTPPRLIFDYSQIKLGRQGVIVRQGGRSGVFLPQVAVDTGWNLDEFLSRLCADKAGLDPLCYQDPNTRIYTFEALVFAENNQISG